MKNMIKNIGKLIIETFKEWKADKASTLAAGLAYYTIMSLGPLVIVLIAILGLIYRDGSGADLFLRQMSSLLGDAGTEVITSIVEAASEPSNSVLATVFGIITALFGATGIFVQLKEALNTAWGVTEVRWKGLTGLLRIRALAVATIIVIGFLLLVSLFLSTALSAITSRFSSDMAVLAVVIQILNQVFSIALIGLVFAFMYKYLPDAVVPWKAAWIGGLVTSALFNLGKYLIGIYLGNSNIGSTYGAAGSLLVLLVWIYYSSQLILLGAEFTYVYAKHRGMWKPQESSVKGKKDLPVKPAEVAAFIENKQRLSQETSSPLPVAIGLIFILGLLLPPLFRRK